MESLRYQPVADLNCRRVLAVPENQMLDPTRQIRVATSYPKALAKFVAQTGINAVLSEVMPGKVEAAPALGVADAIFDIREKGETILANRLRVERAEDECLKLGGLWRSFVCQEANSFDTLLYNGNQL